MTPLPQSAISQPLTLQIVWSPIPMLQRTPCKLFGLDFFATPVTMFKITEYDPYLFFVVEWRIFQVLYPH